MIVVDSCGWLEYFTDGSLADKYWSYLKHSHEIIVPTIIIYEVYKKVKREIGEEPALMAVAQMQSAKTTVLTESLALLAADLSLQLALPMADAIVYATARFNKAMLISSDEHFKGLDGVEYLKK